MRAAPKITLAAHLVFFAAWGAYLLFAHSGAAVVLLETDPVDPRDFLSGHYVTLRYKIGEPAGCPPKGPVWIKLEREGEFWKRRECAAKKSGTGLWARGRVENGRPRFGIERFYVNENSPLRTAVSGDVSAKVSINAAGSARILELVR